MRQRTYPAKPFVTGNPPLEVGQTREYVDPEDIPGACCPGVIFRTLSWEEPKFSSDRMRILIVWAEDEDDPDCTHRAGDIETLHADVGFFAYSKLL